MKGKRGNGYLDIGVKRSQWDWHVERVECRACVSCSSSLRHVCQGDLEKGLGASLGTAAGLAVRSREGVVAPLRGCVGLWVTLPVGSNRSHERPETTSRGGRSNSPAHASQHTEFVTCAVITRPDVPRSSIISLYDRVLAMRIGCANADSLSACG